MADEFNREEEPPRNEDDPKQTPTRPAGGDVPAASETSSVTEPHFIHSDGAAASTSQRHLLLPPDAPPASWFGRHREHIMLAEISATAVFFLLALYFLFLWMSYNPLKVPAAPGRWTQIVLHHTATTGGSPEGIDRYHRNVNKWENGLGYHFLIGNGNGMPDGQIHVGDRWLRQLDGAHVRMRGTDRGNSFSIGIALVGNFQDENAEPTAAQRKSLDRLLRFLMKEYGLRPDNIVGHGDVSAKHTDCPGANFVVADIIESL